ncbi:MAG: hypothetical protein ACR2HH_13910 [Chthoniobacterales bacterium]
MNAEPKVDASKADPALAQQIAEMQAKAAGLQGALAQNPSPAAKKPMGQMPAASPAAGMSPAGMSSGGGMGMDKMGGGPSMAPAAAPMPMGMPMPMPMPMPMGGGMMDTMKMMGMTNMPAASPAMAPGQAAMPQSALPGFAGVSHLYHIGATGFFLDHPQHINLSGDQQAALNALKQQALAAKSSSDQQIEQAEQEIGKLTSVDQPDATLIEKKVRDIEKARADERLNFIRAVGEGAKLLTDDQRKILIGTMQPAAAPAPSPSATMTPMSDM